MIDGFHRYLLFRDYLEADCIPIVVLQHDITQRMAATVQFNRARGVHQVELMGDLVQNWWNTARATMIFRSTLAWIWRRFSV